MNAWEKAILWREEIMYHKMLLISVCLLMAAVPLRAQETAAVFEFESIGVDYETVEAATHIFRSELEATEKFSVLSEADMEAKLAAEGVTDFLCYGVGCASDYGYKLGVEKVIIGTLTALGERVTIEVNLVDVLKKEVEFSDRFSVEYVEDLNSALRKLAEAVAARGKIESEVTRYAITDEETQEPRRKASYTTQGVGFGIGVPLGDSYSKISNLKTVAWVFRYEASNYVVENSFGITWGKGGGKDTVSTDSGHDGRTIVNEQNIVVFPWDIGLRYIFNREKDTTPYIGGGIGLHFIISQETAGVVYTESDIAFAFHGSGGLYLFQTYDFRLSLEAKYTILFSDAFLGTQDIHQQIAFFLTVSGRTSKLKWGGGTGCGTGGCLY